MNEQEIVWGEKNPMEEEEEEEEEQVKRKRRKARIAFRVHEWS